MNYINILDSCNSSLGTCCKDYGLAKIISIYDSLFTMIQIIVPIILIIAAAYQLFKMMTNPDEKKHVKSLKNKFIAAALVFFIPFFINLLIAAIADNTDLSKFNTIACVKEAKKTASVIDKNSSSYNNKIEKENEKVPWIIDPSKYHGYDGNPNASDGTYSVNGGSSSSSSSNNSGDATVESTTDGKKIVAYAKRFVGKKYKYGGSWNGSPNYTPTDCSGFVKGVYAHFGYSIPRVAGYSDYSSSKALKKVSKNELQAGDLVLYSGHVAMLTGDGKGIIHAANSRRGVVTDSNYAYKGSNIKGFFRVKGIN